jgi:hypothetical protein
VNYLAHAVRVLDRPWVLAGTSLPDWLRVVDRRARLRPPALSALELAPGSRDSAVREGVLMHHEDDGRFHKSAAFEALAEEAVHAIRALSPDPRLRASALGHIAVEMLLDAAIEALQPGATARYYRALEDVDGAHLALLARSWTRAPLPQLPMLFDRFRGAQFLFTYETDEGVVGSLAGVCLRTGFAPPPPGTADVVAALRPRVRANAAPLLGLAAPPAPPAGPAEEGAG